MSTPDQDSDQLAAFLHDEGYTPAEIQRVLERLDDFDSRTTHESVFDSIAAGSFDLHGMIKQILEEDES